MKTYCTQNKGNCGTCSLSNYGRDCINNEIEQPYPGMTAEEIYFAALTGAGIPKPDLDFFNERLSANSMADHLRRIAEKLLGAAGAMEGR